MSKRDGGNSFMDLAWAVIIILAALIVFFRL